MKTLLLLASLGFNQAPLPRASPASLGLDPEGLESAVNYLAAEARGGSFPGAVLAVGRHGAVATLVGVGRFGIGDARAVSGTTIYDLASLTKVIALSTSAAILVSEGRLDLDARAADYLPGFTGEGKSDVLVRHLLTHTSGLPPFRLLYEETDNADSAWSLAMRTPLESAPGKQYIYSDLGAMALAGVIEAITGVGLDDFASEKIFGPLGMTDTRFLPPQNLRGRIAPTEDDPWRGRILRGEVHDENAHRLGGVSGHAGLFSTATDLSRFALWLLDIYHGRVADPFLSTNVLRDFVRRQNGPEGSTRALGWDTPSDTMSSAGTILSRTSFGHTGYTGTSIWIDPTRDMFIILLTNRVHPTRENTEIRRVRRELGDLVGNSVTR